MVGGLSREAAQKPPTGSPSLAQRVGEKSKLEKAVLIPRASYSLLFERRCLDEVLCQPHSPWLRTVPHTLWAQADCPEWALVASGEKGQMVDWEMLLLVTASSGRQTQLPLCVPGPL